MARRAGFGDDPAARGLDITQGYRSTNPYFDRDWVTRQLDPYKDSGLSQNVADYRRKSDTQLYNTAAEAVLKFNNLRPGGNNNPPTPNPPPTTPPPTTTPPPRTPRTPRTPRRPRRPNPSQSPRPNRPPRGETESEDGQSDTRRPRNKRNTPRSGPRHPRPPRRPAPRPPRRPPGTGEQE